MEQENHPKNQHIVPRFLLAHFCSEGDNLIWCYDILWKKAKKRNIKGVPVETHFYDAIPGEKKGSLEQLFSRVETAVAPIILTIIKYKNIQDITLDQKANLAIFIILQLSRTKTSLKDTERFNKEYMAPIKNFAKEMNAKLDFDEADPRQLWFESLLFDTPELTKTLGGKSWFLLEANNQFYTSDSPVVRQNALNSNPCRGTLGLNSEGIEIYFPLTPSLVLCIFCQKYPPYRQLHGLTLPCPPETVENINSLQVKFAERFIFAGNNDFELVEDMIKKGKIPAFR